MMPTIARRENSEPPRFQSRPFVALLRNLLS
jgi:hypothetical protein